ncbi:sugar-binding protein [Clostridium magnum]|uniref:D-allose-binding periplasmic protein n=1 Tax=Clostridium magnum DSM 2767 TaxID=1121326 RepID=A0A162RR44_9CLOT|nr:sugar-binding protein [Clostridium magnum]KZL90264.1 D-allose-binding periplasmic protein precursor [Clostridium magnum DSM 2767]SHH80453.1 ribose transport system substrate-binding protein [Clostridium magnum DSM 2767]
MKSFKFRYGFLILICLLLSFSLSYFKKSLNTEKKEFALKPKIVLISHVYTNPYWQYIKKGAEDAAKKRGAIIEYEGPKAASVKEGTKYIDMAVMAKSAGIITYVQDEKQYIPYIDEAVDNSIPVVTVDADAESSKRSAYVGTDNFHAGAVAAKELVNYIGVEGNIGIIMGGTEVKNQQERVNGFRDYLQNNSNLNIASVESSGSYLLEAELSARRILTKNNSIKALYCTSALDGVGAAKAVSSMNLEGKVCIICFDDLPETMDNIQKGLVYATIVQEPYNMGYKAVDIIMDNLEGKKVEGSFNTEVLVIKKDNLYSYKSLEVNN